MASSRDFLWKIYRQHCRKIKRDFLNLMLKYGGDISRFEKPSILWWNDLFDLFTQE